ncbi:hypothetical protein PSECIP111854_02265 [Pseudoalteromonas sp. CIP111854]|uniref:Tat pathway signal protein n=1 Tax=Pseudoalteromonas holothuriae TaxID=2963714 RepID=A0A9W4VZT2_9GAMM|nr:DUF1501 domain-containing protein [Pseudoalteromonas sp. CIP111854]CAH9058748.1 hypothetical protein PSECIP111854_02265 [Pseudoalteromonas sp. CIP111854]
MNRRSFIKASSASFAATSFLSLGQALANTKINNNEDYKAIVCVFLYGGMDNHDTLIPFDEPSYSKWAGIRSELLQHYTIKRNRENLLALNTPARFAPRKFALPPEFKQVASLYQQGKLSIIGNVGPLLEPTNANAIESDLAKLPLRLFSHNDQQSTWMSGSTEGAQFGWAGKLNDALINQTGLAPTTFSAITTTGSGLLITGDKTQPYHVSNGQAANINIYEEFDNSTLLKQHFSAMPNQSDNLLEQDIAIKMKHSFESNEQFNDALASSSINLPPFPATAIAKQLETVSKTIAIREQLGEKRQVFVVAMGGFDTHSGQAKTLPQLQSAMDGAMSAFDSAMQSLGLSDNVTLFTASDFGRTLTVNGDGTDHGWGAHHFIMGGAVNGGTIFGDVPEPTLNHALDAGHGRLIPTLSVDQYAASLGAWLGVEQSTLSNIFPSLNKFGALPNLFK